MSDITLLSDAELDAVSGGQFVIGAGTGGRGGRGGDANAVSLALVLFGPGDAIAGDAAATGGAGAAGGPGTGTATLTPAAPPTA